MTSVPTEHELMMIDVITFTSTILTVAEMKDVSIDIRSKAIVMAEQIFHKLIMDRILDKCIEKATPSSN